MRSVMYLQEAWILSSTGISLWDRSSSGRLEKQSHSSQVGGKETWLPWKGEPVKHKGASRLIDLYTKTTVTEVGEFRDSCGLRGKKRFLSSFSLHAKSHQSGGN